MIDDFEDGDEISLQGGQWFVYDDNDSFDRDSVSYKSQISKMVAVNGTAGNVLNVLYKRDCKDDGKDEEGYRYCRGWLGVGVSLAEKGKSVDLSQCNAIQYDYRGGVHSFRIESVYDKDEKWMSAMTSSIVFKKFFVLRSFMQVFKTSEIVLAERFAIWSTLALFESSCV